MAASRIDNNSILIKFSLTLQATSSAYVCPQKVVYELDKRWSWHLGELDFLLHIGATRVSELQYIGRIWQIYKVKLASQLKLVPETRMISCDLNVVGPTCRQTQASQRDVWPPWRVKIGIQVFPLPQQEVEKLLLPYKWFNYCKFLKTHLMDALFRYIQCPVESLLSQLEEYLVPRSWSSFVNPAVEEGEWFKVHEAPLRGQACPLLQRLELPSPVLWSQSILLAHFLNSHGAIPILMLIKKCIFLISLILLFYLI